MVKLLKNDRKMVKRKDGKYLFVLNQEQLYEADARDKILEDWKKELAEKEEWLKNKDKIMETAMNEVRLQFENMESKVRADINSIKEAIKIWEDV